MGSALASLDLVTAETIGDHRAVVAWQAVEAAAEAFNRAIAAAAPFVEIRVRLGSQVVVGAGPKVHGWPALEILEARPR